MNQKKADKPKRGFLTQSGRDVFRSDQDLAIQRRESHRFENTIPILLIPVERSRHMKFFLPLARWLLTDSKRSQIQNSYLKGDPESYMTAFILSSMVWAILLSGVVFLLQLMINLSLPEDAAPMSILTFFMTFLMFFYLHYIYPSILVKKIAQMTDFELLHVLREMWIDATSGVPLYNILINVAKADYGTISEDMERAVRGISMGEREVNALEKIAQRTSSESFKRILWHLSSAMRTGVGLTLALDNSINMMTSEQIRKIKEYGTSLNFYLLLYLLFAAVIPSIVVTFFAILSAFGMFPITFDLLFGLIIVSSLFQFMLIGLMRAGRPAL